MATAIDVDDSYDRVGWVSHAIDKGDLKPGDHIYSWRGKYTYQHHGIYIGEKGREVIHFCGPDKKNKSEAKICATSLIDFLDRGDLYLVAYGVTRFGVLFKMHGTRHACKSQDPSAVVKTAKYYCENYKKWHKYNLVLNNCEDFAFYCKTGKPLTDGQGSKFNAFRKLGIGYTTDDDSYWRVGYFSHAIAEDKLRPGDHIYCWCGIYQHHGIYIGEKGRDSEVIHFSVPETGDKRKATICATSLEDFCKGATLCLVAYNMSKIGGKIKVHGIRHRHRSRFLNDVVETAEYYYENPHKWPEYSLLLNNSEDFAFHCKTLERLTDGQFSKFNLLKKAETKLSF